MKKGSIDKYSIILPIATKILAGHLNNYFFIFFYNKLYYIKFSKRKQRVF